MQIFYKHNIVHLTFLSPGGTICSLAVPSLRVYFEVSILFLGQG